ncbi:MAG: hypothetical protein WBM99_16230, partial [Psychromonas sp.]
FFSRRNDSSRCKAGGYCFWHCWLMMTEQLQISLTADLILLLLLATRLRLSSFRGLSVIKKQGC